MSQLSIETVDEALTPLLDGLSLALKHQCPVVIHTLWHPIPYLALLPFHLHLRWAGRLDMLPLTSTCSIVPFLSADLLLAQTQLYQVEAANTVRRQARAYRHNTHSNFDNDFVHPDWEEALIKHREVLRDKNLAGYSFLSVDTIGQSGQVLRGTRPYLGIKAVRNAPRPRILVPTRGTLSQEAYTALATTDLLLVNLQRIRGQKMLTLIQEVLRVRGSTRPSLIIASSPSDLAALAWNDLGIHAMNVVIGQSPTLSHIGITVIGKDRPQAEQVFSFAVTELRGYSPVVDTLTRLATAAWWSGRQNIIGITEQDTNFLRFSNALEQAYLQAPSDARLLTTAEKLLTEIFNNQELINERFTAILDAIFSVPTGYRTLVIAKHSGIATQLQTLIAKTMSITVEDLSAANIICSSAIVALPKGNYDYAIACGYFGTATIDTLLSSGATNVYLVCDPVEAGIAWHHLNVMTNFMQGVKSSESREALHHLSSALHSHLLPFTNTISFTLEDIPSFFPSVPISTLPLESIQKDHEKSAVTILFVDGTWIEVPPKSPVEIVDRQGVIQLRTILPSELRTGDEMVIVESKSRILFSEYLIETLDSSRLHSFVEKRDIWFTMIKVLMSTTHPNIRTVHRKLAARGIQVSYHTVLSWTRSDHHTVPGRWSYFQAFAEILGIRLPASSLVDLYQAIRQLRVRHRLAGRRLVRAMRNAYFGRLDSTTLAQIESEWGMSARELMQSTRLMEVDSVLL